MRMRSIGMLAAALAAVLWSASALRAESLYSYVLSPSSQTVQEGDTLDVTVYLQEDTQGGTTVLGPAVDGGVGLFGAGVHIQPIAPVGISLITPNASFDDGLAFTDTSTGELTEGVAFESPAVFASSIGGNLYRVLLGHYLFAVAPEAPYGPVTLQAVNIADSNVTGALDVLVPTFGEIQFNITGVEPAAVPAPAAVWGGLALLGLGARWGKKRAKQAKADAQAQEAAAGEVA